MRQLSKRNSPTFLIRACLATSYRTNREVGPGVTAWKVDQRVGVGFFGGEDGTCEACRRGETAYCQNAIMTGITTDGGYAEVMIAEARALALIPTDSSQKMLPSCVCRHNDLQRAP